MEKEIKAMLMDMDVLEKTHVTESNQSEYENAELYKISGYTYASRKELSDSDISTLLAIRQTKALESIKKMILFFAILTVIGLVLCTAFYFKLSATLM